MIAFLILVAANAFLMANNYSINVEPGKQLPQSIRVKTGDAEGSETTVHYLLFTPKDYGKGDKKWPLLLFLHGLGECGNNELDKVKIHGPGKFVESRPDFPFVLVSPQCPPPEGAMKDVPEAWKTNQLIQLLDRLENELQIDRSRVYVTGLSMGGYGTWRLVAAHPERFAAAVPICGGAASDPEKMAKTLRQVPIWAFHGGQDKVVPLSKSEKMVSAIQRAGGDVKLTVYPDVEHNSWQPTYDNPQVFEWLLEHRKPR